MSNTILTGEVAADILAAMQKAGLNGWEMFVCPKRCGESVQLRFMAAEIWLKSHCPPGWWNSAQRHSKIAVCRR